MQQIIDYLSQYEWFRQYLDYVLHMSDTEVLIVVIITAVLLAFSFYRWFGVGGLTAIVFIYLVIFIIYKNDLYGTYLERQYEEEQHQQQLERELSKDREDQVGGSIGGSAEQ